MWTSPTQWNTPSVIMNSFTSETVTMYTSQESITVYSPFVPSESIKMYSHQEPSRCTHHPFPFSAQDEIACRQQHLHSGRVRNFVARSAVLVYVGCLRSRNAFSEKRRFPQESWSGTPLSDIANGWRNRWHVVLDPLSNLKWVTSKGCFWWTSLGQVITLRGPFWWAELAMTRLSPLLPSPPPCVHSTRPRVCVQNVAVCTGNMPTCFIHVDVVPVHTGTFWTCTRGRLELNAHTGFFERDTRTTTHTNTNTHTTNTNTHTTHHEHTTNHGTTQRHTLHPRTALTLHTTHHDTSRSIRMLKCIQHTIPQLWCWYAFRSRTCVKWRQIHLPHATFSHVQPLHRTHRTNACVHWLNFELRPQNRSFIRASCFTLRLRAHWTLAQILPHLPLLCYCRPLLRIQTCCPRIHLSTVKILGRMVLLRNSTPPQPKRIELNRILVNPQNQTIDDQDDIEEIGVKLLSYSQSLVHSAYDSAESIATPPDSDLEDEQLRKMLASPLYTREREENDGQARAYHSERESLMASSSRELEVSGKPDAVFSCHSESSQNTFSERDRSNEPGNRFDSSVHSVFKYSPGKSWTISSWWK